MSPKPWLTMFLLVSASACTVAPRGTEANRIDEAGFVSIGGIDQWVTIRGDDARNPILLHVHGGPGFAFSAFTDEFASYEADFTVVQWDQRGSGRTFERYGEATPEVTINRIAGDGIEVAEYASDRLGSRTIILFGHSFGTIIGTEMVGRAPNLFDAYVGTGQFASFERTVEEQIQYLSAVAEESENAELGTEVSAIRELTSEGLEQFFSVIGLVNRYLPDADVRWNERMQSRPPEIMTVEELASWNGGRQASVGWLIPQLREVDLFETAPEFSIPFIFIQGSDDIFSPTAAALEYFEHVVAPSKELEIVEGAAHFPHLTHGEQFRSAFLRTTRAYFRQ